MLRRNRLPIIFGALLGLVLAAVYLRFATPVYSTTASIFLEKQGGSIDGQTGGINQGVLYTQCDLLKSSPLLAVAIKNSGAENMKMFGKVHSRIAELKRRIDVRLAPEGSCINIELDSSDPDDARAIVDALTSAYHDFQGKQQHSQALTALALLEKDKARIDADLDAQSRQLADLRDVQRQSRFAAATDGIDLQRMAALSQALTAAESETFAAKAAYAQAAADAGIDVSAPDWIEKNAPDINHPDSVGSAESDAAAREELFRLRQQKEGLSRQFMPGHPAIVALNAKINDILKSLLASARRRWQTATENEKQLKDNYERVQERVVAASSQDEAVSSAEADVKRDQQESDSLDKRIGDLTASSLSGTLSVPLIEPASSSDNPVWPRLWQVLPLGLLLGGFGGLAAARAWEAGGGAKIASMAAVRGKSGKEPLGVPVFATIPRQGEVSIRAVAWSAHLRPESTIAAAFRSVKDGLDSAAASDPGLTPARSILLASPLNGEGRTIAASNLAITLAKSGKRVCLVDADLRSPSLAKVYNMRDDYGVADLLALEPTADRDAEQPLGSTMKAALDRAIQRTVIERLDLLPAGSPADNPEAMLNRPALAEALEELTLKYDHVVIDAPPVLGSADSRIIAAHCDATLLLLSQEASTRKIGEQCRDGLISVGATIPGTLMNSAPRLGSGKSSRGPVHKERVPPGRRAALPEPPRAALPQLPHKSRV